MMPFSFYSAALLAVLGALGVIFSSQPSRALLSLLVTMTALSILYVLLEAPFVAMINLIVYAGAILVLFLFVIMLLGLGARDIPLLRRFRPGFLPAAGLTSGFLILLLLLLTRGPGQNSFQTVGGDVQAIGFKLLTVYLLPFELISLLLLLAILAAVALAKHEDPA